MTQAHTLTSHQCFLSSPDRSTSSSSITNHSHSFSLWLLERWRFLELEVTQVVKQLEELLGVRELQQMGLRAPSTKDRFHVQKRWRGAQAIRYGPSRQRPAGNCPAVQDVSYPQISILTLNFNASFVGNLTNVATLEYFTLTVFSFVFVERCFSCLAWVHQTLHVGGSFFDENTRFFWSRYVVLLDPAKTLVSLVLLLSGRQRWTSAEHVALSISVFLLSPFLLCLVSVSVFGTIQRRLACPCASVDTHLSIEKCSQVSCCTVSAMWCVFFLVSSQGRVFVHSCSQLRTCLADH